MTIVPGVGPRNAKIMLVGEAPAKTEVRLGYPFAGKAGKQLNSILSSAGVARSDCYITNASLEPVQGKKRQHFFGADGKPTQAYLEGIVKLYQDIQQIKPNVVVAFGNYALWALMQHEEIMKWRGSILWGELPKVKVIPTLHPASLLYGEDSGGMWKYKPVIILDIKKALKESQSPEYRLAERNFTIIEDLDHTEAKRCIERLMDGNQIVFDIESFGGLNLACIGFSDGDPTWACCIPFKQDDRVFAVYKELLDSDKPKVGQNLMYDVTFLDQIGIHTRNVYFDTMIAQHVLMTDLPKGLDFITSIYTDIPYYKDEGKVWGKKDIVDYNQFWIYNCKDVCATAEASLEMEADLSGDPFCAHTFEREMALFEPLRGATRRGWLVDRQLLQRFLDTAQEKYKGRYEELRQIAGYDFNPRSPVQVKDLIYKQLGLPPRRRDGALTSREDVLMDLAAKTGHRAPYLVVRVRKESRLISTYFKQNVVSPDDRVRANYNIGGTKTGRLSSSKPLWGPGMNKQNITKKAREMFVADPGMEIGNFDQVQAEAVITAYLAQDPIFIDCFRTGKDVHRVTACLLAGKPAHEWESVPHDSSPGSARDIGKRCNHAFTYGMGPIVFMYTVNKYWDPDAPASLRLTEDQAKALYARYHEVRPSIQAYWQWVANQLRQNEHVLINPFGRKRELLDRWSDSMLKDAYSWIPQGTVADITHIGVIRAYTDPELRAAGVLFMTQTHDSSTWMWPKENREFIVERLKQHLEVELDVRGHHLIMPIEGGVGPNWRAACDNKAEGYEDLGVTRICVEPAYELGVA